MCRTKLMCKTDSLLCSAIVVCCCLLPSLSQAAAWQFEPSIALQGLYNDNARLEVEDPDQIYGATLSPTLKLARYTDVTTLDGFIRLDFNQYWGDTERFPNKNNQLAGFSIARKGERSRLGFRGSFKRDTILRVIDEPLDTDGDPLSVPDSSVDDGSVTENIRRNQTDIRPTITYDLTERWQLGLGYRFQDTFYDDNDTDDDGVEDLLDFQKHSINARVFVPVTEKNKLVSTLLVSRFDSDSDRTTDNFELQAGLRHEFDETTNIILTLGGRYTEFDEPGPLGDQGSNSGFVARLGASKSTGFTTYDVNLERKLSPSGVGDEVQTDELNLNIVRKLTEFMSFALKTRIFENESIRDEKSRGNRRYLLVEPALRWILTETWSINTTYRYRRQKDYGEAESADSNSVFLTLVYQPLTELGK